MRAGRWTGNELVEFNIRGFIGQAVSIEEHLAMTSLDERMNSWCSEKHSLLAEKGHLDELVTLMSTEDPALAEELVGFREQWRKMEDDPQKSPGSYRDLRNRFRQLMGLLDQEDCAVCVADRPAVADFDQRAKAITKRPKIAKMKPVPKPKPVKSRARGKWISVPKFLRRRKAKA